MTDQTGSTNLVQQPYRGTRDFFPDEMRRLSYVFSVWRKIAQQYGYDEYLGPLLENWDLYAAKNVSGEEIVNEQLYWFEDRGGRKVAIRPEMTPTVARMVAQKYQQSVKPLRWFSIANFMRYERPQKGRVREFFQLNIDIFGEKSITADVELIEIAVAIMKAFGATESQFEIRINNRNFIENLLVREYKIASDVINKVMRVIDRISKQEESATVNQLEKLGLSPKQTQQLSALPELSLLDVDRLSNQIEGAKTLVDLFSLLSERNLDIFVRFDASLMRGLDYYTGNVFEQFDLSPDNNRSMFGGGRYDGLSDLFGVKAVPAVGFAPGDVTTLEFLEQWQLLPESGATAEILVTIFDQDHRRYSAQVAKDLREAGIKTELYLSSNDSISDQFSYANKKKIEHVIVIGPSEIDSETVMWKDMRDGEQRILPLRELVKEFRKNQQE